MKLHRFISIKLTCCLIPGILIGHSSDLSLWYFLTMAIISGLGMLYFLDKSVYSGKVFFGCFAALTTLFLGATSYRLSEPKDPINLDSQANVETLWKVKLKEVLKPNPYAQRYLVSAEQMNAPYSIDKILLSIASDTLTTTFAVDDELIITAKAIPISPPLNPHQFNYQKYMASLGVSHQLHVKGSTYQVLTNPSRTPIGIANKLRTHIINKLEEHPFGKEELGIIKALLLGERNDISASDYTNYKNAGALHILALSGLHIGILLLILQFLLQPLTRLPGGNVIRLFLIVVLLWCFAFIAGLSASVVRAVTMFSFVAYALFLNRPTSTFNILALSFFFTLLIAPRSIFTVGFQLSYAAVMAILWIYPKLLSFWQPKYWLVKKGWQLLAVSMAAQLGILPLSLFYFHQFPSLFFIANLAIIPFLGVLLGLGVIVIVLAIGNVLPEILVTTLNYGISFMNGIVAWVAGKEAFIFKHVPWEIPELCLSYLLIILLLRFLRETKYNRLIHFLTGVCVFLSWMIWINYSTTQRETLVLAHQTRNTVLLHQQGNQLVVMAKDTLKSNVLIHSYAIGERIEQLGFLPLQNSYLYQHKSILILDSIAAYPKAMHSVDYLLLTASPRIHLERVLDSVQPKLILADGSNYKSFIKRWKATCVKRKIPFHDTSEKGAFYFDILNH